MNQRKHINQWLKLTPKGFDPDVETHRETEKGLQYGTWKQYEGQFIDERNIAPNEVILDIDAETTEKARTEYNKLTTYLETNGLPFNIFDTGGTSFHAHIFFEVPEGKNWKELRPYRLALYNWIKSECKEKVDAETDLWDDGVVDFDISIGSGHLIRAVGGRKNSTGHRKTLVSKSQLEKEQVEELEEVEYPRLDNKTDYWQISKLDGSKADLTWSEIQDKAEEIKKEEEEKRKKQLETEFKSEDDGLQAVREVPASEALKLIGREHEPGEQIKCPIHDDSNPSAHITEGTESAQMPENRLVCYANSCTENSETETPFKMYNAIDILVEGGDYSFEEAVKELKDEFEIEVELEKDAEIDVGQYFKQPDSLKGFKANRLAQDIEKDFNFVYSLLQEELYVFEEGYYQNKGERLVREECNIRLGDEFKKSRVNDVVEAIKTRPGVAKTKEEFRPPKYKINFENGVYDLMKEELLEHDHKYMFTQQIPHKYKEDAECPSIKEFFNEITESEEDAKTLMELSGYAMLPNMPISAAFLLIGKGGNGKTVFIETLKELLGEANTKDEDLQKIENSKFHTSPLYRKLMVISDDLPSEKLETGSTLKSLTGGGDVRAEIKNGERFEFKNYATPLFACNEIPQTEDQSKGFFRRWILLDFPFEFTENPNPDNPKEKERESEFSLKKRLHKAEELEGYVKQSIDALVRVLENQSFASQKPAEETRQRWNSYASPIMEFIYEYIEQGTTYNEAERQSNSNQNSITEYDFDFIPKDELITLVSAYCEARNHQPPNKTELKKKLDKAELYYSLSRTTQVENVEGQVQVYRGIKYSDKFNELLEECESLQGLHTKLENSNVYGHADALSRLEMKLEKNPAKGARIEGSVDRPRYRSDILEAFENLEAVGSNGIFRSMEEIEEEIDPESVEEKGKYGKVFDKMLSSGTLVEAESGRFYAKKAEAEVNTR